jgi:hypothetical protein
MRMIFSVVEGLVTVDDPGGDRSFGLAMGKLKKQVADRRVLLSVES